MLNCNSQYVPEDSTELELRPGGVTGMFFGGSGGGTEKTVDRACSERSTSLLNIELNKDCKFVKQSNNPHSNSKQLLCHLNSSYNV